MKNENVFTDSLKVQTIWSMLCLGFTFEEIAEAQRVSVSLVEFLEGHLSMYKEYKKIIRRKEYEKIRGFNEKIANLLRLPACA